MELTSELIVTLSGVADGKENVLLTIDGKEIAISITGARDLALAPRQSANRVEKYRRL